MTKPTKDAASLLALVAERGDSRADLGLTKQDLVDVLMDAIANDRPFLVAVGDGESSGVLVLPSNDRHYEWWASVLREVADKHRTRWSSSDEETQ